MLFAFPEKLSDTEFGKKLNRFVAESAKFYGDVEKKVKASDDKSVMDFYNRMMKPAENAFKSAMEKK